VYESCIEFTEPFEALSSLSPITLNLLPRFAPLSLHVRRLRARHRLIDIIIKRGVAACSDQTHTLSITIKISSS